MIPESWPPGSVGTHGEGICCPVVCLPFPWFGQGTSESLELPTRCVAGRTWFTGTPPHRGRHKGDGHIAHRASDPRDDAVTLHSALTQAQTCQEGDPLWFTEHAAQHPGTPRPCLGVLLCTLCNQTQRQHFSVFQELSCECLSEQGRCGHPTGWPGGRGDSPAWTRAAKPCHAAPQGSPGWSLLPEARAVCGDRPLRLQGRADQGT